MAYDYDYFVNEILRLTQIDLSSYKQNQMKRRIDAFIMRHNSKGYEDFVAFVRKDKALLEEFVEYIAKQIDKLIPLYCFMHTNKNLSDRYNSILTRRIFNSHDKNYFPCTENLLYVYEQDFSKEKEYIKKTKVTINQMSFLKKLSDEQGFVIINKEYMTIENAKSLIAYLKGTIEHEPRLFNFFMITV